MSHLFHYHQLLDTQTWAAASSTSPRLLAALASGIATIWVIRRLRRLSIDDFGLLERQLLHLALADLGYAVFRSIPDVHLLLNAFGHPFFLTDSFCVLTHFAYSVPGSTATLVQAHLALGFAAATFNSLRLLRRMSQTLPLCWCFGLLIAIGDSLEVRMFWAPEGMHRKNGYCTTAEHALFVVATLYAVTLSIGLTCYLLCAARTKSAGLIVQRRVWRRAALFPLVFIITCGPIVPGLLGLIHTSFYWTVAGTVYNFNGLMNVIAYAASNRHVHRLNAPQFRNHLTDGIERSASSSSGVSATDQRESAYRHRTLFSVQFNPDLDLVLFAESLVISSGRESRSFGSSRQSGGSRQSVPEARQSITSRGDVALV